MVVVVVVTVVVVVVTVVVFVVVVVVVAVAAAGIAGSHLEPNAGRMVVRGKPRQFRNWKHERSHCTYVEVLYSERV